MAPKYKRTYFHKAKWPDDWITTADNLVRDLWTRVYRPSGNQSQPTQTSSHSATIFDAIDEFDADSSEDALEAYLSSAPLKVDNPILYWTSLLGQGDPLARMALDLLSTPGQSQYWLTCYILYLPLLTVATSCDVERAFSRGRLTVSRMRHSLSDESTRAATVLSSWLSVPGLVPEMEISQVFRDKAKRKKADNDISTTIDIDADVDMPAA